MIFNIPKTIAYLSAGTTLEAGSLIMVTPSDMTSNFRLEPVLELEFSANLKLC
jgi:2-keto-4-pentenoate hydratase/2-oxohepta-3-ene-1,7-dioic acid hydratase in catechol pathway